QHLPVVGRAGLLEVGNLDAAGRAPGGPEVEDDGLPARSAETEAVAGQRVKREIGRQVADGRGFGQPGDIAGVRRLARVEYPGRTEQERAEHEQYPGEP